MPSIIDEMMAAFEELDTYRRFLPYAKGSPSDHLTYNDQYTRANVLFFTDSHIDLREKEACLDNVARTIDFANASPVRLDAVVFTGDAITPMGRHPKQEAINRFQPFFDEAKRSRSPFIFSKGNHDLNDWNNLPSEVLTDRDFSDMFLSYAEEHYNIVRQEKATGERSTWHYYDIEDKKIRIISVDTQDTDKVAVNDEGNVKHYGATSWYISNEQFAWIAEEALSFDDKKEKEWGVIFALHMLSEDTADHESATEKLLCLCEAFQRQGRYDVSYRAPSNRFFDLDIHADFTRYGAYEKKPHIICVLAGHNHVDKNEVRHGINVIHTLNNSCTDLCSDARIVRLPGTSTQNAFDIVNIDTRTRRIRIIRHGAGINCYGVGGDRFLPDGLPY